MTMWTRRRLLLGIVIGSLSLLAVATVAISSFRWRAHVVIMKATGQIPDLEWKYLVSFLAPSSGQSLARLIDTHNPYASIKNPLTGPKDIAAGAKLFDAQCAECHGVN